MDPQDDNINTSKEKKTEIAKEERSELQLFIAKFIPFLRNLKTTRSIVPVYLFFYAFGITFFLSLLLFDLPFNIPINFYYAETGELATYNFPIGDLISVVMFGGVFSLSALRSFELLRERVDVTKKSYGKRLFVVFFYIFFMIILIIGVFSHMISNQLNEYIHQINESLFVDNVFLGNLRSGIYLWDELISHFFIGVGYFCMLYVNTYLDFNSEVSERITVLELISLWIYAIVLGFGNAIGFIEGQSGIIFLGFSIILIISILLVIKRNKLKYRENPFVLCALVSSISYIVTIIVYMILTNYFFGAKVFYPFLYQPSELWFIF